MVDVAIVGGGFTGLSTALHCAQKGLSAHVLEANHIGFGGSGRNVGLVNAALWLPPAKVREKLGATYGDRFLRRFSEGPSVVFDLIEKHQMRCEVTKSGTIHAAHGPAGLEDLKARHAEWQRIG
ncbi:MAG: FAD-binding oxidoreductase, partial [Pseudomonadota bacterium]